MHQRLKTTNHDKQANKHQSADGPWRESAMEQGRCQGPTLFHYFLRGPRGSETSLRRVTSPTTRGDVWAGVACLRHYITVLGEQSCLQKREEAIPS